MLVAGGVLGALGLGGIAGGATLLAFHHKPAGDRCDQTENLDSTGLCRYRYSTLGAGVGTLVGGLALAVTGVALIVMASKRGERSGARAKLEPRLGGLAIVF
jgi:hypothetical protein